MSQPHFILKSKPRSRRIQWSRRRGWGSRRRKDRAKVKAGDRRKRTQTHEATSCISYRRYQPHRFTKAKNKSFTEVWKWWRERSPSPASVYVSNEDSMVTVCLLRGGCEDSVIPSAELWVSRAGAQGTVPTISRLSAPSPSPSKLGSPPCPS